MTELENRRNDVIALIKAAKSMKELRQGVENVRYTYSEFKGATILELIERLDAASNNIEWHRTDDTEREIAIAPHWEVIKFIDFQGKIERYGSISLGIIPRDIVDSELDQIKKSYLQDENRPRGFLYRLQANCSSPKVISKLAVTGKATVLVGFIDLVKRNVN